MAQNIYDDAEFYAAFKELLASHATQGYIMGGTLSLADLSRMLPSLKNATVLDLGCGNGWFTHWAIAQGAALAHGIDVSRSQIGDARAKAAGSIGPTFEVADLDSVDLPEAAYDLVFSSLALHYVKDLRGLVNKVHGALKADGKFYFSVEHPNFTAPRQREMCHPAGGEAHWALTQYFEEGDRSHFWLGKNVEKRHSTMETWVNTLLTSGFELVLFREWGRAGDGTFKGKAFWMTADIGPSFLMLGGRKTS